MGEREEHAYIHTCIHAYIHTYLLGGMGVCVIEEHEAVVDDGVVDVVVVVEDVDDGVVVMGVGRPGQTPYPVQ